MGHLGKGKYARAQHKAECMQGSAEFRDVEALEWRPPAARHDLVALT